MIQRLKRKMFFATLISLAFSSTACFLFVRDSQPLLNKDPHLIQEFRKQPSFPYQADEKRRVNILNNYRKLSIGINGNEVLEIMGNPDEIDTLGFPGGAPRGWMWSYNIRKKYELAPDDEDINVIVYFNVEGKTREISPKNIDKALN